MIEFGKKICRGSKKLLEIGGYGRALPVLCLLEAVVTLAHAQTNGGPQSDWSNLTPPPALSDTNSFQTDSDFSNVPPADAAAEALNSSVTNSSATNDGTNDLNAELAMAIYYKKTMQPELAESNLVNLLAGNVPEAMQKTALLEMGAVVRDENDLPRAQSIYAQFVNRWPDDPRMPEVYLRQGEIFEQMGLTDMALAKFYSVMAATLAIKNDQFAYYQKLVLQTQVEIAEAHYMMGHYVDATDFYSRLLQNPDPSLNRPQIEFRLVRSLTIVGNNSEAANRAQDFISRYPDAEEVPEVRYYLAQAFKAQGRDDEALEQVILCLKQQKAKSGNDPAVWLYWQQRVGNELANQLYHEGDYVHALEIYVDLAELDSSPNWQIPVYYQMGLTYEKLAQPEKATDTYNKILACETAVGTNATPGMAAVFDMAQWRINFLKWQQNAQSVDHSLTAITTAMKGSTNSTANIPQ
jgi:tetratricopeptide (TPR) repeat protein